MKSLFLSHSPSMCIGHIMTIHRQQQQHCILFCLRTDMKTNANTCIKFFFVRFVQLMYQGAYTMQAATEIFFLLFVFSF
jgi:hypothetical protein